MLLPAGLYHDVEAVDEASLSLTVPDHPLPTVLAKTKRTTHLDISQTPGPTKCLARRYASSSSARKDANGLAIIRAAGSRWGTSDPIGLPPLRMPQTIARLAMEAKPCHLQAPRRTPARYVPGSSSGARLQPQRRQRRLPILNTSHQNSPRLSSTRTRPSRPAKWLSGARRARGKISAAGQRKSQLCRGLETTLWSLSLSLSRDRSWASKAQLPAALRRLLFLVLGTTLRCCQVKPESTIMRLTSNRRPWTWIRTRTWRHKRSRC